MMDDWMVDDGEVGRLFSFRCNVLAIWFCTFKRTGGKSPGTWKRAFDRMMRRLYGVVTLTRRNRRVWLAVGGTYRTVTVSFGEPAREISIACDASTIFVPA